MDVDQYKITIQDTFANKFVKYATRIGIVLLLMATPVLLLTDAYRETNGNKNSTNLYFLVSWLVFGGCEFIAGRLLDLDRKKAAVFVAALPYLLVTGLFLLT